MSPGPSLGKPAAYNDFVLARRVDLIDEMSRDARGFDEPVSGLRAAAGDRRSGRSGVPGFHGAKLLDVGCGNGAQTVRLLGRFRHVVGLDVVREHLGTFRRALAGLDGANCSPVLYDGARMPFRDGEFDAVLSIETLEHAANEQQLLREIRRVLQPGGTLVLSVPNKWWIFETHGANLPLLPWNRVPFFSWLPGPIHGRYARARIYTRRGLVQLLSAAGFRVLLTRYLAAPMDVVRNRALAGFLRATVFRGPRTRVPLLSTSVFVMAQRPVR